LKFREEGKIPVKIEVFNKEIAKLHEIFKDVDPSKAQLVEGLIEDAAFLLAENAELRERMAETGMVEFHPTNPKLQRTTEAAKQYLKNVNSYAVVIKTLNGVLSKNMLDPDDGMDEFE